MPTYTWPTLVSVPFVTYTLFTCLTYLLSFTLTHTNPQLTHPQLNNPDQLPSLLTCCYSPLPIICILHMLILDPRVRVSRLSLVPSALRANTQQPVGD